jgi:hypothetical protein
MATITAKFSGTCKRCGGAFPAGAKINWEKGAGSTHVACPTAGAPTAARLTPVPATSASIDAAPYVVWEMIRGGGGAAHVARQIGTTRLYAAAGGVDLGCGRVQDLPQIRDGATVEAAVHGVYVVVGAGNWRYQNAEDNEDMGDMGGANSSGPLYLRRATAEEVEADTARRWEAGRPARERITREAAEKVAAEQAQAAWVAACASTVTQEARAAFVPPKGMTAGYYVEHPEAIDVCLGSVGCGMHVIEYLTPDERTERTATLTDIWQERRYDHGEWRTTGSYLRAWGYHGQIVAERYTYIYDFDQPVCVAGCADLMRVVRDRDEQRRIAQEAERAIRDRIYAGDAPLICERFIAALEVLGTVGDQTAFGEEARKPLPADWTTLRDEIVALGAAAFVEPAAGAGALATLLYSATGGRPGVAGGRHGGSPRFVYGEWKKIHAVAATQRAA